MSKGGGRKRGRKGEGERWIHESTSPFLMKTQVSVWPGTRVTDEANGPSMVGRWVGGWMDRRTDKWVMGAWLGAWLGAWIGNLINSAGWVEGEGRKEKRKNMQKCR